MPAPNTDPLTPHPVRYPLPLFKIARQLVGPAVAAVALLGLLAVVLALFRLPVAESLRLLAEGAFADKFAIARTALKTTPLLLTGLGMIVAWRAGMYNIGGEGQFVVGGVTGAAFAAALAPRLPPILLALGILACCIAGGAFWAWIPAWLYLRRGVEVVISTILLNFVAVQLLAYAVSGPLQGAHEQVPLTEQLPAAAMLYRFDRQTDFHIGFFIALACAALVYVFLYRTTSGFQLRLSGESAGVARAYRIDANAARRKAMLLSGALCGLAGGVEYLGTAGQIGSGFSQQWGFLGIPVALLAGLHPLGAIPSAAFFGALFAGSENLARFTSAGATLVYVIQAVAVLGYVVAQALGTRRIRREDPI